MDEHLQEYSETLTINLASNLQRANAAVVGSGILLLQAIVDEINKSIDKNEQILIKNRPFAGGSLELPFDLIVLGAVLLIQEQPSLQMLCNIITQFFEIKQRLQGKPLNVENGNIVIIENSQVHVESITLRCLNPLHSRSAPKTAL